MSSVQVFQNKVKRRLAGAGLEFDRIDSYGPLVSAKLRVEKVNQPARLYAHGVLDVFPEGEVYDYFQCVGLDGREYLTIRFKPGAMDRPAPKPTVKRQWVKDLSKPTARSHPQPAAKPQPQPEPVPGPHLTAGQIAWTIIPKADGSRLKQARCQVVAVKRDQVEVKITKTGRQLRVPVSKLFDHVPRQVGQTWQ